MKKLFLSFNLLIFLSFPSVVSAASLTFDPPNGTFNRGCPVSIKIDLDTQGAQTDGTDAIFTYPANIFTTSVSQILPNTSVYPDFPGNSVDTSIGRVTISGLASASSPFVGKGALSTVNFTVVNDATLGPATFKFDFDPNDKTKTTDSNVVEHGTVVDLLSLAPDAAYTIGSGPCPTGRGLVGTPSGSLYPSPTPVVYKTLPQGASINPTIILGGLGTVLILLGLIGVAIF